MRECDSCDAAPLGLEVQGDSTREWATPFIWRERHLSVQMHRRIRRVEVVGGRGVGRGEAQSHEGDHNRRLHCSTSRSQPDLRLHTLKVGFARASVYALADRLDEVAPERTFQESAMGASLPLACMPHYDIRSRPTGRKPIFAVAAPSGHKAALPRSRDGWKADLIILPVSFARKSVRVELLPIAFCQQQSWAAC
jgi:hypothetical protein